MKTKIKVFTMYFLKWFFITFGVAIVLGVMIAYLFDSFNYTAALGTAIGIAIPWGTLGAVTEVKILKYERELNQGYKPKTINSNEN